MYLDEVVSAQKCGEAKGIASICSAHPRVLGQGMEVFGRPLIEATCNQVNQFGGYTGMTPKDFVASIRQIAGEHQIPFEHIMLGGDHLGPHVWQKGPCSEAMAKARVMIADYVRAGFTKLHLDCSMRLQDDPEGALDKVVAAKRAAELAQTAERTGDGNLRYVIGTEVPYPGGATMHEDGVHVTEAADAQETMEIHHKAFMRLGLEQAWERVIAIVVQPGVEFGDDFVLPYDAEAACELSKFIEGQPMVYEAHSTDYQTRQALTCMVRDHFAILKVGPALTFAYREGVFALAMLEKEWIPASECSNLLEVMEQTMTAHPQHWRPYYRGTERERAFKRKYSLSDRARYYWARPEVQGALDRLMHNLGGQPLPNSLSGQFLNESGVTAEQALNRRVRKVLLDYSAACGETG